MSTIKYIDFYLYIYIDFKSSYMKHLVKYIANISVIYDCDLDNCLLKIVN